MTPRFVIVLSAMSHYVRRSFICVPCRIGQSCLAVCRRRDAASFRACCTFHRGFARSWLLVSPAQFGRTATPHCLWAICAWHGGLRLLGLLQGLGALSVQSLFGAVVDMRICLGCHRVLFDTFLHRWLVLSETSSGFVQVAIVCPDERQNRAGS